MKDIELELEKNEQNSNSCSSEGHSSSVDEDVSTGQLRCGSPSLEAMYIEGEDLKLNRHVQKAQQRFEHIIQAINCCRIPYSEAHCQWHFRALKQLLQLAVETGTISSQDENKFSQLLQLAPAVNSLEGVESITQILEAAHAAYSALSQKIYMTCAFSQASSPPKRFKDVNAATSAAVDSDDAIGATNPAGAKSCPNFASQEDLSARQKLVTVLRHMYKLVMNSLMQPVFHLVRLRSSLRYARMWVEEYLHGIIENDEDEDELDRILVQVHSVVATSRVTCDDAALAEEVRVENVEQSTRPDVSSVTSYWVRLIGATDSVLCHEFTSPVAPSPSRRLPLISGQLSTNEPDLFHTRYLTPESFLERSSIATSGDHSGLLFHGFLLDDTRAVIGSPALGENDEDTNPDGWEQLVSTAGKQLAAQLLAPNIRRNLAVEVFSIHLRRALLGGDRRRIRILYWRTRRLLRTMAAARGGSVESNTSSDRLHTSLKGEWNAYGLSAFAAVEEAAGLDYFEDCLFEGAYYRFCSAFMLHQQQGNCVPNAYRFGIAMLLFAGFCNALHPTQLFEVKPTPFEVVAAFKDQLLTPLLQMRSALDSGSAHLFFTSLHQLQETAAFLKIPFLIFLCEKMDYLVHSQVLEGFVKLKIGSNTSLYFTEIEQALGKTEQETLRLLSQAICESRINARIDGPLGSLRVVDNTASPVQTAWAVKPPKLDVAIRAMASRLTPS